MTTVRLAVSYLNVYGPLVSAVMPRVVAAFAPFDVNLTLVPGHALDRDPAVSDAGWEGLIADLTRESAAAGQPWIAHMVVAAIPPRSAPGINGQLMEPNRGISAIFLGAPTFRSPSPERRPDLVTQVLIHEIGHMMDLTHDDDVDAGYSSAMLQTIVRLRSTPVDAWRAAQIDMKARGEAAATPLPTDYYPFGRECRACLREASRDARWLPWGGPLRPTSDPGGDLDQSVRVRLHEDPSPASVGSGVAFTLSLKNTSKQPILLPAHLGPEFGTLRIALKAPGQPRRAYIPPRFACTDQTVGLMPGEETFRSLSVVPSAAQPIFEIAGLHELHLSVTSPAGPEQVRLGRLKIRLPVSAKKRDQELHRLAAKVVASTHGFDALPTELQVSRLLKTSHESSSIQHAQYRLAATQPRGRRIASLSRLLRQPLHTAVRRLAALTLAQERLIRGDSMARIAEDMRKRFTTPQDQELHDQLKRMGDEWHAIMH